MSPPSFPIVARELGAGWTFAEIDEGPSVIEGFQVLSREIPHKGGRTFGYRISDGVSTIAYLSDHSPTSAGPGPDGLGERHEAAMALAAGANLLIHDAQHLAVEFPDVADLGHASVEYAVALGRESGANLVALFHHAPDRTDDEIDLLLSHARAPDVKVVAAYEGMSIDVAAES